MPKIVLPPPMLSLDMATHTGWAHSCDVGGMVALPDRAKGETNGARFNWFMQWVEVTTLKYPTELITYEAGTHKQGGDAMRIGIGMMTSLEIICHNLSIPCIPLHTNKIKKHATGNGAAKKHHMITAARAKWVLKHYEENYVDAKWQLDYALSLWKNGELL